MDDESPSRLEWTCNSWTLADGRTIATAFGPSGYEPLGRIGEGGLDPAPPFPTMLLPNIDEPIDKYSEENARAIRDWQRSCDEQRR